MTIENTANFKGHGVDAQIIKADKTLFISECCKIRLPLLQTKNKIGGAYATLLLNFYDSFFV